MFPGVMPVIDGELGVVCGVAVIVLFTIFAELVEFVAVRAKTLKLYEVLLVSPVMLAVVCPDTRNELL